MRVGPKGTVRRVWAATGRRPRVPRALGFKWTDLFGAVCPARGAAAGLVLPVATAAAMALHLQEIGAQVAPAPVPGPWWCSTKPGTTGPKRWRAGSRPT
jgi:putative transposase